MDENPCTLSLYGESRWFREPSIARYLVYEETRFCGLQEGDDASVHHETANDDEHYHIGINLPIIIIESSNC